MYFPARRINSFEDFVVWKKCCIKSFSHRENSWNIIDNFESLVLKILIWMIYRGKEMLQYEEEEMTDLGGYDLVHYDDLAYVASAHQECKFNFRISYFELI